MLKWSLLSMLLAISVMAEMKIDVVLDHADAMYKCNEQAVFTVTVKDGENLLKEGAANIRLSNDGSTTISTRKIDLAAENPFTTQGTMDKPGILSLDVRVASQQQKVNKVYGAAFEPFAIQPGAPMPDDFMDFWKQELKMAEATPLDPQLTPMPRLSNAKCDGYKVSFAAPMGRVYGFMTVPKAPGKYPAIVCVPGAGPGDRSTGISENIIYMNLNVHAYDPETPGKTITDSYNELNKNGIYMYINCPDRRKTYFYHGIIGISRAIDWLSKHEKVDARRIGYHGSSQGGAFGFILGGLTGKFRAIVCNVPAMCDQFGYMTGRPAGWPQFCRQFKFSSEIKDMAQYYDALNFARFINVPVRVIVGLADRTCCPSSVFAAYNAIPSQDKQMVTEIGMGHEVWPSYGKARAWLTQLVLQKD